MEVAVEDNGQAPAVGDVQRVQRRYALCAAIAMALAIGLRFYSLTGESLWLDEIFSVWMCRAPWAEMWRYMHLENHPPLYYLMLRGWMGAFGPSDYAARSLSAVAGILAVGAIGLAGRRIAGERAGLIALGIAAVAPPLVRYSQEARMYSPAILFAALALAGGAAWLDRPSRRSAALFAGGLTLTIYTHYYGIFLWAAMAGAGATWLLAARRPRRDLRAWMLACAIPLVAFLPWLPVLRAQLAVNWTTHWLLAFPKPPPVAPMFFVWWCFGVFSERGEFFPLIPAVFTAAGLATLAGCTAWVMCARGRAAGARTDLDMTRGGIWLALAAGLVPAIIALLASSEHNMWQNKYLLVSAPGLICAVAALLDGIRAPRLAAAMTSVVVAECLVATLPAVGSMGPWNQEQWREAAAYLRPQVRPGDAIVVPENTTLPPCSICLTHYGVAADRLLSVRKDLAVPAEVAALDQACARTGRVWLVTRGGTVGGVARRLAERGFADSRVGARFERVEVERYDRRVP